MNNEEFSRRAFLLKSLTGVSAAWLAARWPDVVAARQHAHKAAASTEPIQFEFFTPEQAVEIEAMAAQIIPTDSTPGAREAHVIYFIDRALTTFDRAQQPIYLKGFAQLQAQVKKQRAKTTRFSELTAAQQIKTLKAMEKSGFFQQVRAHTIMGFLSLPEHGGNYNKTGWQVIGFDDQFYHKPPFGYYDREYKEDK